jgi:hypothetical protein
MEMEFATSVNRWEDELRAHKPRIIGRDGGERAPHSFVA